MTIPTKPGVYPGLKYDDYWHIEAVNHSVLKRMEQSPAHAYAEKARPREPTKALVMGDAVHAYALEPKRFEEEYVRGLDLPRRKNIDKEAHRTHAATNAEKTVVDYHDWDTITWMRHALEQHSGAMELLESSPQKELSIVWKDEATELLCKARYDGLAPGIIWDLKSAEDASAGHARRQIANLSYDTAAAFYRAGAKALTGEDYEFHWVYCEKSAPWGVQIHTLNENSLWQAGLTVNRWLEEWAEACELGEWRCYPEDVSVLELPVWRQRYHEADEEGF